MSASIDQAFIKQFETEVHLAFQRMGSKLLSMIRRKTNLKGKDTTFQLVGKGQAGTKSRHGQIPLMNLAHTNVTCTLADYYAGDFVDALDELKTNIDERQVVAQSGAAAIGRKSDELIVTAISASTTNALVATGAAGLTQTKVNTTYERFGAQDVPDDGNRFFAVDPYCWTDLLAITAFSSADYVGPGDLPYKGGMTAKRWMGFLFFPFSGLNDGAGGATEARNLAWHKQCVGGASGTDLNTDVTWQGKEQAHLFAYSMSQGAVVIDGVGIQVVDALR